MPNRFLLLAICLAVGAFCTRLGFWQLDRLSQRRAANDIIRRGFELPPSDLVSLTDSAMSAGYRRVRVSGAFDFAREFAIGPRAHQGSPGTHIVTPLRREGNDTLLLVVRGWVYAPDARTVDFERWREADSASIDGYSVAFDTTGTLDSATVGGAPTVRRLHRASLERRLAAPLPGYYIVATSAPDTGISVPVRVSEPSLHDGSHLSYAVQWFLFAAVFGVGGTLVVLRGRRQGGER